MELYRAVAFESEPSGGHYQPEHHQLHAVTGGQGQAAHCPQSLWGRSACTSMGLLAASVSTACSQHRQHPKHSPLPLGLDKGAWTCSGHCCAAAWHCTAAGRCAVRQAMHVPASVSATASVLPASPPCVTLRCETDYVCCCLIMQTRRATSLQTTSAST